MSIDQQPTRSLPSHATERWSTVDGAVIEQHDGQLDVEAVFRAFANQPHALFFDSARRDARLGRYSYLLADPFEYFECPADGSDALAELQLRWQQFSAPTIAGLPPFQGGAAGLFGYELGRSLEQVPRARIDEFSFPALAIGLYDVVLAIDHVAGKWWLISQGFPEHEPAARRRRATDRLQQVQQWLPAGNESHDLGHTRFGTPINPHKIQQPVPGWPGLTSDFTRSEYLAAVQRTIEYIHAGDAFQVNLSQRFLQRATSSAAELYVRTRRQNPAPFAAYFDLGETQIVSTSPERFLKLQQGHVEARPIKGTRPRASDAHQDRALADELLQNEKDRAENVMIVDLLRNDLSRVCRPESVQVTQLCQLESFEHVHHLVSAIEGQLRDGHTAIDLLRATFPGGSITGAPKVRAMEIIAELEPTARGAYCGSLAYLGFDGALDTSILIRTITASGGWWQLSVGGGIVAQSEPALEYEETWHKAAGMLQAMRDVSPIPQAHEPRS